MKQLPEEHRQQQQVEGRTGSATLVEAQIDCRIADLHMLRP